MSSTSRHTVVSIRLWRWAGHTIGVRRWALSRGWWESWGGTEQRFGRSGRGYYISPALWGYYPWWWWRSAGHLVGTVCARCRWDIITDGKVAHLCLHWGLPWRCVKDIELRAIPTVLMGRRGGGWLWEQHCVLWVAAGEVVKAAVSWERGTAWWRRVIDGWGGGRGWVLWEEAVVRGVFSWGGGGCGRAVRGEVVIQVRLWRGRLGTLSMGSKKTMHICTRELNIYNWFRKATKSTHTWGTFTAVPASHSYTIFSPILVHTRWFFS